MCCGFERYKNLQDKWFAILHHVVDEHVWLTGLGRCDHEQLTGPPTDGSGKEIQYFTRNEKSFAVLRKLITDKKWLKSLHYYTRFRCVLYNNSCVHSCL